MSEFAGKRVVVTGGASGIGRAVAEYFAGFGAKVSIIDLSPDAVAQVAGELSSDGNVSGIAADVRDEAAIASAIQTAGRDGGIDIAVCAAGILRTGPFMETDAKTWQDVLDVNLTGAANTCRALIPLMRTEDPAAPRRKITLLASATAMHPKKGIAAYAVSKVGVVNLARVLASEEAGNGININAIAPGTIETPMIAGLAAGTRGFKLYGTAPVGRMGHPRDIAFAAAFLSSSQADFITGIALPVDGGTTATFPAG